MINNNFINLLPTSIGFLRNLHTLIADSNQIKELPTSIGSCVKLTLLSLAFNELTLLPEEIGRLSQLKVLNLRANKLKYLPFTLTSITNLRSLWLSENQQKPIMKLQTDTDEESGAKILTCFLLPQQSSSMNQTYVYDEDNGNLSSCKTKGHQENKIKFSPFNQEIPEFNENFPSKLIRNPTPYPKELKAHARHARNLALKNKESNQDGEDGDGLEGEKKEEVGDEAETKSKKGFAQAVETQSNQINNLKIKEAKVAKASIDELDQYEMELSCQESCSTSENRDSNHKHVTYEQYPKLFQAELNNSFKDKPHCIQILDQDWCNESNQGWTSGSHNNDTNMTTETETFALNQNNYTLNNPIPVIDNNNQIETNQVHLNHLLDEKLSSSSSSPLSSPLPPSSLPPSSLPPSSSSPAASSSLEKKYQSCSTNPASETGPRSLNYPNFYDQSNIYDQPHLHPHQQLEDVNISSPSSLQFHETNQSSMSHTMINSIDQISSLPSKDELMPSLHLPTRTSPGPRNKLISAPSKVIIQQFSMGLDTYRQMSPNFGSNSNAGSNTDGSNIGSGGGSSGESSIETKTIPKFNSQTKYSSSVEPYHKCIKGSNANIVREKE